MQISLSFPSDGVQLAGVLHLPDSRADDGPLPAFLVLHGFVGSKDSSQAEIQAKMLEDMGYAAFRFDFRCCGESEGDRGQVRCLDQVADTSAALSFLAQRPEIDPARIAVIGHSFGAAIAIYSAGVDPRIAAVISTSGWGHGERKFRGQHPTPEAWKAFTDLLEAGKRHKETTGESLWVSRFDVVPIPEEMRRNLSPKALMQIPVETAQSMVDFRAEDVVAQIAPRPLLLLHATNDEVTPSEQSLRLFEKAGQPTELMMFTSHSHFPLSGADAPRTRLLIQSWLDKFFPARAA